MRCQRLYVSAFLMFGIVGITLLTYFIYLGPCSACTGNKPVCCPSNEKGSKFCCSENFECCNIPIGTTTIYYCCPNHNCGNILQLLECEQPYTKNW